jgi:hypothetical protein
MLLHDRDRGMSEHDDPLGSRLIQSADGTLLLDGTKFYPSTPWDMADWQLIAAAPELLDALKAVEWNGHGMARCPMCFGWDSKNGGEGDKRHSKDCKLAAAIAKAEGR